MMNRNLGVGSWPARRAALSPRRRAYWFNECWVSYEQLHNRTTRLANALIDRGVQQGDRVAYLGHNHPAALETLFACGIVGATYVPIHPGFNDESIQRILAEAQPKLIVASPEFLARVSLAAGVLEHCQLVCTADAVGEWESFDSLINESSMAAIDRVIDLKETCVLAFTSGTTGPNKGVRLSHENMLWNAMNTLTSVDYRRDDVLLSCAPLYRMGGLGFTLSMLLKGGACVIQQEAHPEGLVSLVERHGVTVLFDAVHAFTALLNASGLERLKHSSLRLCLTGGSQVPSRLVKEYKRLGIALQPGYGLTEASPLALMMDPDEMDDHPTAAGRPVMFCAARVVDEHLNDVRPGELGELVLSGPNVTMGYWNSTATRAEQGWFHTGDAALIDKQGVITIVGRLSDSLILGGRRVHPGPVEEGLHAMGHASECALIQMAPDASPDLFLVPTSDHGVDAATVMTECQRLLGDAAVSLHIMESLPKNPNGKILRHVLQKQLDATQAPIM